MHEFMKAAQLALAGILIGVRANVSGVDKMLCRRAIISFSGGDVGSVVPVNVVIGIIARAIEPALVIVGEHLAAQAQLLEIIQARNAPGALFGFAEGRQKHRGKDGNDRDDDEQFDQSEAESSGDGRAPVAFLLSWW